jgi:kynureninase
LRSGCVWLGGDLSKSLIESSEDSQGVMLKAHFKTFLQASPDRIHLAAHSHHPWPDVALAAHARYAQDSALHADHKWDIVFGEVIPQAQRHIARELQLSHEHDARITFAPNTAEFVARLYSCFDVRERPMRVLTTDAEFHSFGRMTRRLEEAGQVVVTRVSAQPYASLLARLQAALQAAQAPFDLFFVSHVLFESGYVLAVESLLPYVPPETQWVIDGYHAYMALPIPFRSLAARAFYLAGGYKYAMAGEGACWLYVPPYADQLRPLNTGWFADFAGLAHAQEGPVGYGDGGSRFFGATFDASGLYRLNAVQQWLCDAGVTSAAVHQHSLAMQTRLLEGMAATAGPRGLSKTHVLPLASPRGNFCTFDVEPLAQAIQWESAIKAANLVIDRRGTRLRFGLGVYHEHDDVDRAVARLAAGAVG